MTSAWSLVTFRNGNHKQRMCITLGAVGLLLMVLVYGSDLGSSWVDESRDKVDILTEQSGENRRSHIRKKDFTTVQCQSQNVREVEKSKTLGHKGQTLCFEGLDQL